MDSPLQTLAYLIASAIIPAAIYFYLNTRESSREAKYQRLREEIARTLAYQIGEGRSLSAFEIHAVIDSKLRDFRTGAGIISVDEVVEDLVSETMTTLMLEGQRKEQIIDNLRRIHEQQLPAEDRLYAVEGRRPSGESLSTLFAWVAPVVTVVLFVGGATMIQTLGERFRQDQYVLYILLGLTAGLISLIVASALLFVVRLFERRENGRSSRGRGAERVVDAGSSDTLSDAAARLRQRVSLRGQPDSTTQQPILAGRAADSAGEHSRA